MRSAAFALDRPSSVSEAVALLGDGVAGARALAGGQTLIAQLTRRELVADRLVDLGGIAALRSLSVATGGALEIGAMVTLAELEDDPSVDAGWPLLAEAVRHVGHRPIRNRSTVGGCLAFADPPAEVPLALAVLDARVVRDGPLITGVVVPPLGAGVRCGFAEISRRYNDRAEAGAAALVAADGGVRLGLATREFGPVVTSGEIPSAGGGYGERALRECARRAIARAGAGTAGATP